MLGFRLGLSLITACLLIIAGCVEGSGNGDGSSAEGGSSNDTADQGGDGSAGSGSSGSGSSGGVTGSPGSGSSGGAAPPALSDVIDTGLSSDQNLSDLSADEAIDLCERFNSQADAVFSDAQLERVACISFGAIAGMDLSDPSAAFDVAACEQAVDECVASGDGTSMTDSMCDEAAMDLAECDITAGEMEACYNALLSGVAETLGLLSCEAFTDPQTLSTLEGSMFDSPPQCDVVDERCPALSPNSGDAGSSGSSGEPVFGGPPSESGCDDTCVFNNDTECDDGGPGSDTPFCGLGTDCADCGPR
jgi:hypothetical protein